MSPHIIMKFTFLLWTMIPVTMATTSSPKTPMRPPVPPTFSVHVECIIINKNQTTEAHEYFDDVNNRALVEQHQNGVDFKGYYDYNHNEFLGVDLSTGSCTVSRLNTSSQRFLMGYKTVNGSGHMFSASGALHFGSRSKEVYIGSSIVRDVRVNGWRSHEVWPGMNATMNITWYFSDPNNWETALSLASVPIRCHVTGIVQDSSTHSHTFDHIYEFRHFRDFIDKPRFFELDDGIVCPGRINTKPLPPVRNSVMLVVESVNVVLKTMAVTSEWFDSDKKLSRYDTVPTSLTLSKYGSNRLTIVRDFNSGLQYVKDQIIGNCSVTPLSNAGWDDRMVDPTHIRMATAKEFFHLNNATYTYTGVKTIRSIPCDTWIAKRKDFPVSTPTNSTWEWAFVISNWTSSTNLAANKLSGTPLRLLLGVPSMGVNTEMNIFHFQMADSKLFNFDVKNCMLSERRRSFKVAFYKQSTPLILKGLNSFKLACATSIYRTSRVDPLRVANVQVTISNKTVFLTFDLTDEPPIIGNVKYVRPTSLNDAANNFVKTAKAGQFIVTASVMQSGIGVNPSTIEETTTGPTGLPIISFPPVTGTTPSRVPMRPTVPNTFSVHVDCVIRNKNQTTEVHEYFDDLTNRAMIEQHAGGINYKAYYDYKHNEFIGVDMNTGVCTVSPLNTSSQRFLMGYKTVNGTGHIFSASGALHFGSKDKEVYIGPSVVRDIRVNGWRSHEVWPSMNATMNITWYFSDPNNWETALAIASVPVRCHVIGVTRDNPTHSHTFDHIYEFRHFRDFIDRTDFFELNDEIVCSGRINSKQLPVVSDTISLNVETVNTVLKTMAFTSEWFDVNMKLTRFDMRPNPQLLSKWGSNRLTIVRDYNTGLQYVKDQIIGNCSVVPLGNDGWDDHITDPTHIRMDTAQEFFHFNNASYAYNGVKTIRGVPCDTWIAKRTDIPYYAPTNSTWEWAFVVSTWNSSSNRVSYYQSGVPLQLHLKIDSMGVDNVMNVFQYKDNDALIFTFDVKNCMLTEKRRSFRLGFSKQYTTLIAKNMKAFRKGCFNAIYGASHVNALRVANVMVHISNNIAYVTFDLTDVPPINGTVNSVSTSLNDAANYLVKAVKGQAFTVMMQGTPGSIPADPSTLEETAGKSTPSSTPSTPGARTSSPQNTPSPQTQSRQTSNSQTAPGSSSTVKPVCSQYSGSGYSAGVMAGVSVVMLVVGGSGGGGLAFMLSRKRMLPIFFYRPW